MTFSFLSIIGLSALGLIFSAIRILREYQRGVVFCLAGFIKSKGRD